MQHYAIDITYARRIKVIIPSLAMHVIETKKKIHAVSHCERTHVEHQDLPHINDKG